LLQGFFYESFEMALSVQKTSRLRVCKGRVRTRRNKNGTSSNELGRDNPGGTCFGDADRSARR
jgi:hypothetical protein